MSIQHTLKNKKIIFVLYSFDLGGAERQALKLARYLITSGASVEMWAFTSPGRLSQLCEKYNIRWKKIHLSLKYGWLSVLIDAINIGLRLRRANPCILLPYLTPANLYCGLSWRFTGAKLCIWNQRSAGVEKINSHWEKVAVNNVPVVIANSQQGADYLIDTYRVKPARVHVVYNGVDLDEGVDLPETWKTRLELPDNSFVACMLANFHTGKDHETLLEAWTIASKKIDRPGRLVLAGRFNGTEKKLMEKACHLGIKDTVLFLESVDDIAGLLKIADVGVLLSPFVNWEGCPNAVLEYMMIGLPVIGTDTPAIRETVGEKNFSFLAPIRDVGSVAKLLITLASDNQLRHAIGNANLQRVQVCFSAQKMFENTTDIINQSLDIHT